MTETNYTSALATLLESRLMEWDKARKPQEQKMLECYQDVMRIPREDDTTGTGTARAKKAKGIFIGSTRNKVRAARAKVNDALFGAGRMPFDTEPKNEKLSPFADLMEDIITDQLERGKFQQMLTSGTDVLATYGTGFIFGPFVRKETLTETQFDQEAGAIVEQKYEFDLPYFELGNSLDVVPDAEAREIERGMGVFWVTMESPHTVKAWKSDKNYQNVDAALIGASDEASGSGSERAAQLRGNIEYWHQADRIKVARYFGKIPKKMMAEFNKEPTGDVEAADGDDLMDVIVVMAGGVVVKLDESPYGGKMPVHRCVWEAVPNEIWGVGPAENNMPHQKVTNAAFRLFMEGKGMALLGTKAVDKGNFLPTEDFKKYPGKVYAFKPNLSAEQKKESIIDFKEEDITGGWLDVIRVSEQFSDDDTGITKYTQGDDSSNLNKTATGISMIMSASSLPMKEVIQHIDQMWIEPEIECLVEWNLKYLEPETVAKIFGEEKAQLWAQIKQFGKASFMTWKATGTASFMQKEILTNKIRAFADFALSNPSTAPLVDARELLEQTWDVMEIGRESPVVKDEQGKANPQVEQLTQQVQQLDEVVQKMSAELESKQIEGRKLDLENRKLDLEESKLAIEASLQSATAGVGMPELVARFDAIEQMLMDVMHGVKNPAHLDELPAPGAPQAEPAPEMQAPPDPMEPQPTPQAADAAFFTPEA